MKDVHLEPGHCVQFLEDKLLAIEMAGQVEHQSPVAESGVIEDFATGDAAVFSGHRAQVLKALAPAEEAFRPERLDFDALGSHGEEVGLLSGIVRQVFDGLSEAFRASNFLDRQAGRGAAFENDRGNRFRDENFRARLRPGHHSDGREQQNRKYLFHIVRSFSVSNVGFTNLEDFFLSLFAF